MVFSHLVGASTVESGVRLLQDRSVSAPTSLLNPSGSPWSVMQEVLFWKSLTAQSFCAGSQRGQHAIDKTLNSHDGQGQAEGARGAKKQYPHESPS